MAVLTEQEIYNLAMEVLTVAGLPHKSADIVSRATVAAHLRGVSSHGLQMLHVYLERVKAGGLDVAAQPIVEQKSDALWSIDGNGAFGQLAAWRAVELIGSALAEGRCAVVGVHNTNHCGMLAFYTQELARQGGIGMMTTNTNPNVAPYGGAEKILGTNPFSLAFPTGGESIVIDMATTALAKGKLYEYAARGQALPEGIAVDSDGLPITDPSAALSGVLLPFAGYKGYAISLAVELLSGVFTGSGYSKGVHSLHRSPEAQQNVGMFLMGIPADAFLSREEYNQRTADFQAMVTGCKKAAGTEQIYFPGELEELRSQEHRNKGMAIDDMLLQKLQRVASS